MVCMFEHLRAASSFGASELMRLYSAEYQPGQGIMSHVDGPMYFPVVANLSLGSHTIMNLAMCRRDDEVSTSEPPVRLLLEPRSLLLLSSQAYVKHSPSFDSFAAHSCCGRYLSCMHGIEELTQDIIDSSVANIRLTSAAAAHLQQTPSPPLTLTRTTRVSLTIRYVPKVALPAVHMLPCVTAVGF